MRARELKRWLAEAERLTPAQQEQVLARLQGRRSRDLVARVLAERTPTACPHCADVRIVRHGQANGVQRFRCRGCGKTFNPLTGTALAGLRHRDRWLVQAEAMEAGLSIRKTAARMGVHRTTAFRWRHRFLAVARETRDRQLGGVVEADEAYFLRSFKGQRRQLTLHGGGRRARRRGGQGAKRGLSAEQVPVFVARNRHGQMTDYVLPAGNKRGILAVLPMAVAPDAVLCTDGSAMLASAARDLGIEHHALNTLRGERQRGAWHVQNVNAHHSRLKGWIARFRGVATSYLPNYLGWFRALERNAQTGAGAASLLRLAMA
ncbi:IS1595 family transposase [Vulcaniibacterium gelatinicum]|uniref:IS1595 family transposase n=1 Tax=Vulcaniibacterium gelatinicum TaxID=2598725 RepID=UPI0011C841D5|nr:IS1595 family transposase [Vulcaniibacterium gelatinicum]